MIVRRVVLWVFLLEVLIVLIVPALLIRGFKATPRRARPGGEGIPSAVTVRVLVHTMGRIEDIPLETYVIGVVAAEMPASFAIEALKAQAVVARTYVAKRMRVFGGAGSPDHPGVDICTDPSHAQAWIWDEEMKVVWGPLNYERCRRRIEDAVALTAGLVITYDDRPIDPVYHSTSGGPTEEASEVWQNGLPYLRSVPCDFCSHSPYYRYSVDMPLDELGTRLGDRSIPVLFQGGKTGLEVIEATATGRVKALRLAGTVLRGQEIRAVLGLPSTRFTCETRGAAVRFSAQGKGHGVGMCQYGADGMARKGKTFQEIIEYYYSGVRVRNMFEE